MSIHKILVPTDFSECAFNATRYAARLAKSFDSKIILISGYQIPMPAADFSISIDQDMVEVFEEEAQDNFTEIKKEIPELNELSCTFKTKMALARDAIMATVEEDNPDLIIMGTHGHAGLGEKLLGSITASVIKHSNIPVMAIPDNVDYYFIDKIALGCDYHPIEDLSILDGLMDFIRVFDAELHILHVSEKIGDIDLNEAYEARKIDQYFYGVDHYFHEVADAKVEDGIDNFISKNSIKALALMPRQHNVFEKLFKHSVTRRMALQSKVPILVFPTD
mgnify:CR=1 FL=1